MTTSKQAEFRSWNDWTDPDFFEEGRQTERRFIPLFIRQIIPLRFQRTKLTLTGWMLIFVAMGIGSAAYNTASNILFMTLSLMLSSLVLSGILSLINFKKLKWNLKAPAHLQVGEVGAAEIELENLKSVFPSMSICFRVGSSENTKDTSLYMPSALPAGATTRLEWTFKPLRRGPCQINLHGVGSKFPFGFLDKSFGETQEHSVLVWPARVDYHFSPEAKGRRYLSGVSRRASGLGSDLLNIREYVPGDPPRLIHWKATARVNKLMVRQVAQEGEGGFHLVVDPDGNLWSGEQFERLCSVVCSLSDDLFHAGRLDSVCVAGEERTLVRSMRDLHGFFDRLAVLSPMSAPGAGGYENGPKNRITFRPQGEGGIAIYVDDLQVGQADD
ncbi:hypothetical protein DDZ13_04870 [Coraliomargarita sinensis]|uniref:DUF58 domain-containing protein n=1 Tax=Coraliomargarita sinensis TaxID=2174842 RepID=A0A317ZM93_9BACT|nr:DUF58 domain-containing protein [Coraliomargarita sinensis]PXA04511.1 hypothetical protein DDZ13_04870 [Coraliomargarita sinensis]